MAGRRGSCPSCDSDTSASTSSVSMSAMVTTAPLVSTRGENGVMMSPTLAFLVSTTPSNGARISVCSTATSAALRFACATPSDGLGAAQRGARLVGARDRLVECRCADERLRTRGPCERSRFCSASRSSACACSRLAAATFTLAATCSRVAPTSRLSSRAITSPFLHAAALAHAQPLEPAGRLGRDRRLALGDDVAGGVEHRVSLRRIRGRHRGGLDRHRRRRAPPAARGRSGHDQCNGDPQAPATPRARLRRGAAIDGKPGEVGRG